ncbi:hypothetical protein OXX69_000327 [Metschnikowia pulcherrima]
MNTFLPIATILLLLVACAPGQGLYRHFSLLNKGTAVSSNGVIEKTIHSSWEVFDEMVGATQILMAEKTSSTASDILIANIIDLYIRMFSMYTVQGTLDRRSPQIYETVLNFYVEFCTWSEKFWALSDIPPIERLLFLQYTMRFEIRIKDAMSQL